MNRVRRGALASAIGLGLVLGSAVSVSAATCPSAYMCTFNFRSFGGGGVEDARSSGTLGSVHSDEASSAATNGASCTGTRYYDAAALAGSYMFLNSEQLTGMNYRDPNLSNGAGTGSYASQNWEDRISGWRFTGC